MRFTASCGHRKPAVREAVLSVTAKTPASCRGLCYGRSVPTDSSSGDRVTGLPDSGRSSRTAEGQGIGVGNGCRRPLLCDKSSGAWLLGLTCCGLLCTVRAFSPVCVLRATYG